MFWDELEIVEAVADLQEGGGQRPPAGLEPRPTDVELYTFDEGILPAGLAAEEHAEQPDYGDIVTFVRKWFGFEPEPLQIAFLTSEAKRGIVKCSRQWGKSTLAALKAIYRMLTRPGCLILVAGPCRQQTGEFMVKFAALMRRGFPEWTRRGDGFNPASWMFPNGSRIVYLAGEADNVRGFSAVSMLIIDEAAGVPDELYGALRPMLAVGNGDLWVLGTPKGKQGFFYEEWEFGGERWARFEVVVTDCAPRISREFLEDEMRSHDAAWVQQEYFGKFMNDGATLFERDMVERALTDEWGPLELGSGKGGETPRGFAYIGLDLGKLRDYTAVVIVEAIPETGMLVARYAERAPLRTPYQKVAKRVGELTKHRMLAGRCHLTMDATGVGHPVMEMIMSTELACKRLTAVTITSGQKQARSAYAFGRGESWNVPRRDLLNGLQLLLEKGELQIARGMRDAGTLVRELVHMRLRVGAGGESGAEHDDLALGLALACWEARRARREPGIIGTQRLL